MRLEKGRGSGMGFTSTREFRWLLGGAVFLGSLVLVLVLEIRPLLERRHPGPAAAAARVPPSLPDPLPGERDLVLFDGLLGTVEDGGPLEDAGPAHERVLTQIARAPAEKFPPAGPPAAYRALLASPGEARGRTFRLRALLVHSDPIRLERPIDGREWVHRAYLVDPRGEEGYVVDLLERPDLRLRSLVEVNGVFLRLAAYEGKRGRITAPHFAGRGLRAVEGARAAESGALGLPFGGALLAVTAAAAAAVFIIPRLLSRRVSRAARAF